MKYYYKNNKINNFLLDIQKNFYYNSNMNNIDKQLYNIKKDIIKLHNKSLYDDAPMIFRSCIVIYRVFFNKKKIVIDFMMKPYIISGGKYFTPPDFLKEYYDGLNFPGMGRNSYSNLDFNNVPIRKVALMIFIFENPSIPQHTIDQYLFEELL